MEVDGTSLDTTHYATSVLYRTTHGTRYGNPHLQDGNDTFEQVRSFQNQPEVTRDRLKRVSSKNSTCLGRRRNQRSIAAFVRYQPTADIISFLDLSCSQDHLMRFTKRSPKSPRRWLGYDHLAVARAMKVGHSCETLMHTET